MPTPWSLEDAEREQRAVGGSEAVNPPPLPPLESPGLGHFVPVHTSSSTFWLPRFLGPPPRGKRIHLHGNHVVSYLTRAE